MLANIDLGALLEGGQAHLGLYSFRFLTRCSLLFDDVDARCATIPFHSETRRPWLTQALVDKA